MQSARLTTITIGALAVFLLGPAAAAGADQVFYLDGATTTYESEGRNIYHYLSLDIPARQATTTFTASTSAFFVSDPLGVAEMASSTFEAIVWLRTNDPGNRLQPKIVKIGANFDPHGRRGDLNCDRTVDEGDVSPFVLALVDPVGYETEWPDCEITNGDINQDGLVNAFDIDGFANLLTQPPLTVICEMPSISIGATQIFTRYSASCPSGGEIDFAPADKLALVLVPVSRDAVYYVSTGVPRTDGYSRLEVRQPPGEPLHGGGGGGGGGGEIGSIIEAPKVEEAKPGFGSARPHLEAKPPSAFGPEPPIEVRELKKLE